MKVVIGGASGLLGTALAGSMRQRGHDVVRLTRREATGADESRWDPYTGLVDRDLLGSADVVVNLAGAPLVGNPHSQKWADAVRTSRVTTTRVLAEAIAAGGGHATYLAGNGISFYGDHGGKPLTESSDSRGDALLTSVARDWEEAALPASEAGARVCVLRTAPVLDRNSAPLKQLMLLFKLGLGGKLGDGRQYFPVISLRDWVDAVVFLAETDAVSGPVNLCCPDTPTNAEFTQALARAVSRPAFLPAPAFVLRPAAGRLAPELLGSVNARPQALLDAGFRFSDPDVAAVIAAGMSSPRAR